jgi:hypothetical protein
MLRKKARIYRPLKISEIKSDNLKIGKNLHIWLFLAQGNRSAPGIVLLFVPDRFNRIAVSSDIPSRPMEQTNKAMNVNMDSNLACKSSVL